MPQRSCGMCFKEQKMKVSAIIAAAGSGSRMGIDKNKLLLEIEGKTVIERTLLAFENCKAIDDIVVVAGDFEIAKISKSFSKVSAVVPGGGTRQESVLNGINAANGEILCVHDGARCFVTDAIIEDAVNCAKEKGASTVAVDVVDTIRFSDGEIFGEMVDRSRLKSVQTPQCFKKELLLKAYEIADGTETDESLLVSKIHPVYHVCGSRENIKITTKQDLSLGASIVKGGK